MVKKQDGRNMRTQGGRQCEWRAREAANGVVRSGRAEVPQGTRGGCACPGVARCHGDDGVRRKLQATSSAIALQRVELRCRAVRSLRERLPLALPLALLLQLRLRLQLCLCLLQHASPGRALQRSIHCSELWHSSSWARPVRLQDSLE